MCVQVKIGKKWVDTYGQLKKAIGATPDTDGYSGKPLDGDCLCIVNIPRTLDAAGYEWVRDECCDYVAKKLEQQQ